METNYVDSVKRTMAVKEALKQCDGLTAVIYKMMKQNDIQKETKPAKQ